MSSLGLHCLFLFSILVLSNIIHFHGSDCETYLKDSRISMSRNDLSSNIKPKCPNSNWDFPFENLAGIAKWVFPKQNSSSYSLIFYISTTIYPATRPKILRIILDPFFSFIQSIIFSLSSPFSQFSIFLDYSNTY